MSQPFIHNSQFKWIEDQNLGRFSGIAVPVFFQKKCFWMQLDTGLDQTILYGNESLKDLDVTFQSLDSLMCSKVSASLCGYDLERKICLKSDMEPERNNEILIKGAIGLDWLIGCILTIDLKQESIRVSTDTEGWNDQFSSWVPLVVRNNKIFPEILFGYEKDANFFLDTGTCAFSLVVDYSEWKYLVDQEPSPVNIERRAIDVFGKELNSITARTSQRFQIGSLSLDSVEITYIEEYPDYFSSWPFFVRGLIGMKLFRESIFSLNLCNDSQPVLSVCMSS